jgi:hypothetical protein
LPVFLPQLKSLQFSFIFMALIEHFCVAITQGTYIAEGGISCLCNSAI